MITKLGSITAGDMIQGNSANIDKVIMNIQAGLDAVNYKEGYPSSDMDMALIADQIQQVEGKNGTILAYEDFQVFFQDYAPYTNPQEYNESYSKWTLFSRSYVAKNGSFDKEFFKQAKLDRKNPADMINKRTESVLNVYQNIFKPAIVWSAILEVPTSGGTYYEKFGALDNVTVDPSLIENYDSTAVAGALKSNVRNHFRCVADGTNGVSYTDIDFVKQYFNEYTDVDVNDLVMVGTMATLGQMQKIFEDTQVRDDFKILGIPTTTICGIPSFMTKKLPDDILMFYVKNPNVKLVTELVNDVAEFKGLRVEGEKSYTKFETMYDLEGSRFVIEDIGEHLTGRRFILFLDLNKTRASADRLMGSAGKAVLTSKRNREMAKWKANVV